MKFNIFFIDWSKFCAVAQIVFEDVAQNLFEDAPQNYQATETGGLFTAQTNQAAMLDFITY